MRVSGVGDFGHHRGAPACVPAGAFRLPEDVLATWLTRILLKT